MTTQLNVQTLGGHGRLFVEPNWFVDSISSLPECDLAVDVLKDAVERIERNLALARAKPDELVDREWFRKANGALKLKKLALIKVGEIRAKLEQSVKADKLAEIKRLYRETFGPRDRLFSALGDAVYAGDDSGGFNAAENCEIEGAAELIAELLNFASEL
jgi:hypothetical protein